MRTVRASSAVAGFAPAASSPEMMEGSASAGPITRNPGCPVMVKGVDVPFDRRAEPICRGSFHPDGGRAVGDVDELHLVRDLVLEHLGQSLGARFRFAIDQEAVLQ